MNAACQGNLSAGHFGHACYKVAVPVLVDEGRWLLGEGLVAVICLSLMVSKPNSRRGRIIPWDELLTGLCERRSRQVSESEEVKDVLWRSAVMWLTVAVLLSVDRDKNWAHNKGLIYFQK